MSSNTRKGLFKTVVVIWSEYNPSGCVELEDLARDATTGKSYCSRQDTIYVPDPVVDPDWDCTEFFMHGEHEQ